MHKLVTIIEQLNFNFWKQLIWRKMEEGSASQESEEDLSFVENTHCTLLFYASKQPL